VTDGDSSASPADTVRIASTRSSGELFFSRKPVAPAGPQRLEDVLVVLEGGQDQHPGAGRTALGEQLPGGGEPVDAGHLDVHQHDVRSGGPGDLDRLPAVRGLADDLQVGLGLQDQPEAGPHHLLVVREHHPDRHTGMVARTS